MNPGAHVLGRRLSELRVAQEALAAEAWALEAEGTYALLASGNQFTGATAERARPALAQVAALWRGLALLDDLLGQVEQRTDEVHVDDNHAARLMALVNGPGILVAPDAPPPGDVDLALLPSGASSRRTITPNDLLASLQGALAPAHQVVAEIDAAWRELVPRLDRVTAEAARLAAELPALKALVAARAVIDALPGHIVHDPLGAVDELTRIESALADAAGAGAELARLGDAMAAAARTLAELEGLLDEGRAAFDRSRAEIASPEGLLAPVDRDVLSREPGLRRWLARLERLVSEGDMSRAGAGLERWRSLAEQTMAVARQVAEANALPWRRRRELEGLLRATRVKAGAVGRAEDPLVSELAGRALRSLAVPCDLPAAESAIEDFLEGLRNPVPASVGDGSMWARPILPTSARPSRWAPRTRADGCGRRRDRHKPLRVRRLWRFNGRRLLRHLRARTPGTCARHRSAAGLRPLARGRLLVSERRRLRGWGAVLRPPSPAPDVGTHRLVRPEGARRQGLRRGGQPPARGHTAGARPRRRPRRSQGRPPGGGHAGRPGPRGHALLLQVQQPGRALPQPPAGSAGGILPPVPDPVLLHASARTG